jgi:hypothetical protein
LREKILAPKSGPHDLAAQHHPPLYLNNSLLCRLGAAAAVSFSSRFGRRMEGWRRHCSSWCVFAGSAQYRAAAAASKAYTMHNSICNRHHRQQHSHNQQYVTSQSLDTLCSLTRHAHAFNPWFRARSSPL